MIDFDELNALTEASIRVRNTPDEVIKDVRGWLEGLFARGILEIDEEFEFYFTMSPEEFLNREIEGKTYEDRIREHWQNSDVEGIKCVVATEANRMYNCGRDETAKAYSQATGREVWKIWNTQHDNRVRTSHSYLESEMVRVGEPFYTYDGDSAMYPGGFEKAENNVNCRCFIEYS